jgi:hypothetical protein
LANPYISMSIRCAGPNCDHVKQTTNHWILMEIHNSHGPTISFGTWSDIDARQDGVLPLCGDACAIKMMQKWLSDQKSLAQGGPVE